MFIIKNTDHGVKISLSESSITEHADELRLIWNDPSQYYNFVDISQITEINDILDTQENYNIFNTATNFVETINQVDHHEFLSLISDCTRKLCFFNRYCYKTRDVVFDFITKELQSNNINNFKIAFFNSFKLLTELFYLTELIKQGYIISEIHLIDPVYHDFLCDVNGLNTECNAEVFDNNKTGWMFYQFLEYFDVNGYPLEIYIHANPIDFGNKNKHRIDVTIDIDGSPQMIDVIKLSAIKMTNHPATINFEASSTGSKLFGHKYNNVHIIEYKFSNNDLVDEHITNLYNLASKGSFGILIGNALYNTVHCDKIENMIDTRYIKHIRYTDLKIYLMYIFFICLYTFFLIFLYIFKDYYYSVAWYILVIIFIIGLVYTIYKISSLRLLNSLKIIEYKTA